jgi:streptogramin lyase
MRYLVRAIVVSLSTLAIAGCALIDPSSPTLVEGLAITGKVTSGTRPVAGAHVYLMAANFTGYGAKANSVLQPFNNLTDSTGSYVVTEADGSFAIDDDYVCTAHTEAYILVQGGNMGLGVNPAASLMAILGACPIDGSVKPVTYTRVNEVTTVAAAYAMAGFATDETHVSSSGTKLAELGLANAFTNASSLASNAMGNALSTTPAGNGAVPAATINTLANILTACVNSTGPGSSACTSLFSHAKSRGSIGITPTHTATAALNMAHNPSVNVTTLFGIPVGSPVYSPALSDAPNDFTVSINYTGGGLSGPVGLAIDGSGNAWAANVLGDSITKLSPTGAALSGPAGFTGGGISQTSNLAIDAAGNVWTSNFGTNSVTKLSPTGAILSGPGGYTGGGLKTGPNGIAIDSLGNAWIATDLNVAKLSSTGVPISGPTGYIYPGMDSLNGVAIDVTGNAWVTSFPGNIFKLSPAGANLSIPTGFTGGGLNVPLHISVDGGSNAWVSNLFGSSVTKLASTGVALSGPGGFTDGRSVSPFSVVLDGVGNVWMASQGPDNSLTVYSNTGVPISGLHGYQGNGQNVSEDLAVDSSGNVWIANFGNDSITEVIGGAVPVVTPLAVGVATNTLATKP